MGFLDRIVRKQPRRTDYYVHDGIAFTQKLIDSLGLEGWQNGLPVYTAEEQGAILQKLAQFQRQTDELAGGDVGLHPEFVDLLIPRLTAEALEELAAANWKCKDELPIDWKGSASTYLKAWAARLSPFVLVDLARLLTWAGYRTEAKQALNVVVLWFPWYAPKYWESGVNTELLEIVMTNAKNMLREL